VGIEALFENRSHFFQPAKNVCVCRAKKGRETDALLLADSDAKRNVAFL